MNKYPPFVTSTQNTKLVTIRIRITYARGWSVFGDRVMSTTRCYVSAKQHLAPVVSEAILRCFLIFV